MKGVGAAGLALLLVVAAEAQVDAYLDPGSGSMLVQLLLGGVAGAAVIREARLAAGARHVPFAASGAGMPKERETKPNE